jgi:hypothetical protein
VQTLVKKVELENMQCMCAAEIEGVFIDDVMQRE